MGGLAGSWTRILEDRRIRQERDWRRVETALRATGAIYPTLGKVAFELTQATKKRRCLVHGRQDRCWRKGKSS